MKKITKLLLSAVFYYSGLFHLIRLWNNLCGKRLTILMFHRITNSVSEVQNGGLPTINLSLDNFELLIKFIVKHYNIISLKEYLQCVKDRIKLAHNCLILSFDDGYKEILENALPVLRKYGKPAVLFVPTAVIDEGGFFWWDAVYSLLSGNHNDQFVQKDPADPAIRHYLKWMARIISKRPENRKQAIFDFIEALQNSAGEIREGVISQILNSSGNLISDQQRNHSVLRWNDVRELAACGFEIGSHTVNHQFLSTVSDDEAMNELKDSKDKLESHLNCRVSSFSYPGGKYTDRTIQLVEAAGYSCGCTTEPGLNSLNDNLYKLKRINMWDGMVMNPNGKFSKALTAWSLFLRR